MISGWKRAASLFFCLALLLSGCGYQVSLEGQKLEVTKLIGEDELLQAGETVITEAEAKIFLLAEKQRMEETYTSHIWYRNYGGHTMAWYMDQELSDFLVRMAYVNEMASQMGITLSETEKQRLRRGASDLYAVLSPEELEYTGITSSEDLETVFYHYYMLQKVMDQIRDSLDLEISDNEARVITVQQIFTTDYADAEAVLAKIEGGADMYALSSAYNESDEFERTLTRADLSETYENAVYSLSDNEVSPIFYDDGGYYVVKCISSYNVEETVENKSRIADQMVSADFDSRYESIRESTELKVNNEAAADFSFSDEIEPTAGSFYTVYQNDFS